jgi:hypothetical protein
MIVIWYIFGIVVVLLILLVRFYKDPDEHCEYCLKGIDTETDNYLVFPYAVQTGELRVEDEWIFCSTLCQQFHYQTTIGGESDV